MDIGKDEKFHFLDYTHDEIEFLLDKIYDGYVLSKDVYDEIIKILNSDTSIGFSGDYNDLKNKPDIVKKIIDTLKSMNVETSDTVDQKINPLQDSIKSIQDSVSNKAEAIHTHSKSDIDGLQSSLNSKADFLHYHDERYPTIEFLQKELDDIINNSNIDLSDYVTNGFLKEQLDKKASKDHTHKPEEITELDYLLASKADVDSVYDKWTIDTIIEEHNHNDDYYTKKEVDSNFATAEELVGVLDDLALKSDVGHKHDEDYYTKEEVEEKIEEGLETIDLSEYVTTEEMNVALAGKSDVVHSHDEYALQDHDHSVEDIEDIGEKYYDKGTVNSLLDFKSDTGHGHDISEVNGLQDELESKANKDDIYSKEEVDQKLNLKADADHKHDISEVKGLREELDLKANAEDVYVKDEINDIVDNLNTKIDSKSDANHKHDEYAKIDHEHVVEEITDLFDNVYDKSQTDDLLASKADADHKHDNDYAKVEHEHTVEDITGLYDNVYTEKEVDELLSSKSDVDHRHDEDYAKIEHTHKAEDIEDFEEQFYNKEEIDEMMSGKSDSNHKHDDDYAKIEHEHTVEDITDLYNNVYNKTQVDEALATKSEIGHGHNISDIANLQDELDKKIDKDLAATKEELEQGLNSKSDLNHKHDEDYAPIEHNHDDQYHNKETMSQLLEKAKDDARIAAVTEANVYTATEIANLIDSAPEAMNTINELAQAIKNHEDVYEAYVATVSESLASKADAEHAHDDFYYTKEEVDEKVLGDLNSSLAEYAKTKDVEEALALKSEIGHTHECSDITDLQEILDAKADSLNAATKDELNALKESIAGKADADHTHDMSEIEDLQDALDSKINKEDAASKDDLATKSDVGHEHNDIYYTKEEIDDNISSKIEGIDFATKEDLALKADADHAHDISEVNGLQTILDNKINKEDAALKEDLALKADADHKHDDLYYTKNEIDENISSKIDGKDFATKEDLALKADADHVHDISEVSGLQDELDARTLNSYTKEEVNELLSAKLDILALNIITNEQIDEILSDAFEEKEE